MEDNSKVMECMKKIKMHAFHINISIKIERRNKCNETFHTSKEMNNQCAQESITLHFEVVIINSLIVARTNILHFILTKIEKRWMSLYNNVLLFTKSFPIIIMKYLHFSRALEPIFA